MEEPSHKPGTVRPASAFVEEPQWFLISEDRSLSLRLVSGAILCEGADGALVTAPEQAAHAARFDIVEDELWLSCLAGRIRADGRVVTAHHRVFAGVQLHIGHTRYYIAGGINDSAPDVPLLENQLAPGETRLPRPSQRHIPVFYSGPLEIEEIVITESVELPPVNGEAGRRTASLPDGPAPVRSGPTRQTPSTARGRMTALLLTGLAASATLAGWHWANLDRERDLAARLPDTATLAEPATALPAAIDPEPLASVEDPVMVDLAHLAWADRISPQNHNRLVRIAASLDTRICGARIREDITHYARRLVGEVQQPDDLESMVLSLGRVLAPHAEFRSTLALLENRVIALRRTSQRPVQPVTDTLRLVATGMPAGTHRRVPGTPPPSLD